VLGAAQLPLLPTAIIGSYAAPGWYHTILEHIARGDYGDADIEEVAGDAAIVALADQERAGVDIVSEGELRRSDFIMGFYSRLEGLRSVPPRRRLGVPLYDSTRHFETTGKVHAPTGLGTVAEFQFATAHTLKPVKVAVAGPITLLNPIRIVDGYHSRESLLADLVAVVRAEVHALFAAGCSCIQIDESYYQSARANPNEIAEVFDAVTDGIDGAMLGLHVCFGNLRGRPHSLRSYADVLPSLRDCRAQVLFLEFANREMAEVELWRSLEMPQTLAAGVVDVKSAYRERPEDVLRRLQAVLQYCPSDRLWAVPDCGLWETPRWLAYRKLQALTAGAELARKLL
jgi:5-methyltetrahydropteroyltriglutamate--homocysteine methyltransferase